MSKLKQQIKSHDRRQAKPGRAMRRRQKALKRALKSVRAKKILKALKRSHRLNALAARTVPSAESEQPASVFSYLKRRTVRSPDEPQVTVAWFLEWNEYGENDELVDMGREPLVGITANEEAGKVVLQAFGGPEEKFKYNPEKRRQIQHDLETAFLKWATSA